jgi:hypothetical protein
MARFGIAGQRLIRKTRRQRAEGRSTATGICGGEIIEGLKFDVEVSGKILFDVVIQSDFFSDMKPDKRVEALKYISMLKEAD